MPACHSRETVLSARGHEREIKGRGARIAAFRGEEEGRMQAERDYQEIFRRAGARWLEGDPSAIGDFEKGIGVALDEGDMAAALSAHQRLLVWKPGDKELHRRVAQAIAAARDRPPRPSETESALAHSPLFSGLSREELTTLLTFIAPL